MDIWNALLYLVAIFFVTIWLHVSIFLLTRHVSRDLDHIFRLVVVALITVFVVPIMEGVGEAISVPGIGPIIAFVVLIYTIFFIITPNVTSNRDDLEIAIWIGFFTLLFIFAFNAATKAFLGFNLVVTF